MKILMKNNCVVFINICIVFVMSVLVKYSVVVLMSKYLCIFVNIVNN